MFSVLYLVTNAMVENYSRAVGHGENLLKYLYQGENNYKLLSATQYAAMFKQFF
jgi:hypothetical protein